MAEIVIVGAGPAGIAAAEVLCDAGHRPILIDEGARAGGQGYRRPAESLQLDMTRLMGSEAGKYAALHRRFEALKPRLDYRPNTLVWAIEGRTLHLLSEGGRRRSPSRGW